MKTRKIFINAFDKKRLMTLIEDNAILKNPDKIYLNELEKELNRGEVVEPEDIPKDVITMNSMVHLKDLGSGEEVTYTLVFPGNSDISDNKISILAPIGTALIGYRVGDIIEWEVPAGLRRLKVEEILYQPEAAGDYDL